MNVPQYVEVLERTALYFALTYIDSIAEGEAATQTDVIDVRNGCYFITAFCEAINEALNIKSYDYAPHNLM